MNGYNVKENSMIEIINVTNNMTWYTSNINTGSIIDKIFCGNDWIVSWTYWVEIWTGIIYRKEDTEIDLGILKNSSIRLYKNTSDNSDYSCYITYHTEKDTYEIVKDFWMPIFTFLMIIFIWLFIPIYYWIKMAFFVDKQYSKNLNDKEEIWKK